MEKLFWSNVPKLTSPHPLEPKIVQLRKSISAMWEQPLASCNAFLDQFNQYQWIVDLDVDAHVASLEVNFNCSFVAQKTNQNESNCSPYEI